MSALYKKIIATVLVLAVLGAVGAYLTIKDDGGGFLLSVGNNPELPTITFYTSGGATTPQLPFWWAVRHGSILEHCNLRVKIWKNLDDLRGVLLAGKGDLWLGHTEGFAQAALKDAPLRMLVVSGWRKFYLLSTNQEHTGFASFQNRELAFTPVGSPAVTIMKAIAGPDENNIHFKPFEAKQLSMLMIKGEVDAALVPEPLVTVLLSKVEGLQIIDSVEERYGIKTGHPSRMPIAGLAVHTKTAEKHPDIIRAIAKEMIKAGQELQNDPHRAINALPEEFASFIPAKMVKKSLTRDIILVKSAMDAREEIEDYLHILMPERKNPAAMLLPDDCYFQEY